jgi:predicted nucleic acid-binding protein
MTIAFVDTSYLLALLVRGDAHHGAALAWKARARSRLVTTEYVLVELVDALSAYRASGVAIRAVHALQGDAHATIVPASAELLDAGLELLSRRADKRWSLTDCISFVVMERHGLTEALTADRHFEQAGFRALLLHEPPDPA